MKELIIYSIMAIALFQVWGFDYFSNKNKNSNIRAVLNVEIDYIEPKYSKIYATYRYGNVNRKLELSFLPTFKLDTLKKGNIIEVDCLYIAENIFTKCVLKNTKEQRENKNKMIAFKEDRKVVIPRGFEPLWQG